ncbi:hypothetical protein AB1Y20_021703 [Prymnesium parvum]|uniref:Uncharacterized protein n=1 Tax=Prymnesium parvum TaxID=97485 RepID=A0AB34JJH2_PRYPA
MALSRDGPAPLPLIVDAYRLADDAVTTYKLADGAVTAQKLAAGAVGRTALAASAVTEESISSSAVSERALGTGVVRGAHIAAGAISSRELSEGAVREEHVAFGAIGVRQLDTSALLHLTARNLSVFWGWVSADGVATTRGGDEVEAQMNEVGTYTLRWSRAFAAPPLVFVNSVDFAICFAPPSQTGRNSSTVHCRQPGFSLPQPKRHDESAVISLNQQDGAAVASGFNFLVWA